MAQKLLGVFVIITYLYVGVYAQNNPNTAHNPLSQLRKVQQKRDDLFYKNGKLETKEVLIFTSMGLGTILSIVGTAYFISANQVFYDGAKARASVEYSVNLTDSEYDSYFSSFKSARTEYDELKNTGLIYISVGSAALLTGLILIVDKSIRNKKRINSGYRIRNTHWGQVPIIPQTHLYLDLYPNSIGITIK